MATIKFKPGSNDAYSNGQVCHFTQICIIATNQTLNNASIPIENSTFVFSPPLKIDEIHRTIEGLKKDKGYEYINVYGNPETIGEVGKHLVSATSPLPNENSFHDEL